MNVLLMTAHSIAEYDDVRMLSDLGYDVFSIGAYSDPANPGDDKRPALVQAPRHPDLAALTADQMRAKEHIPDDVLDWADVIVVHHYVRQWVVRQWDRIRHKRVIWRTCGQSDFDVEDIMTPLHRDGLAIVRYSPAEEAFFKPTGHWAGADALIRFGKYPDDWGGWEGWDSVIANVTQDLAGRGDWCGLSWYLAATQGLKASPAGPKSEGLPGGAGALSYDGLRQYLRRARAYVYTGTVPASYTLGFIEAMMTGIPIVSLAGEAWAGPAGLWEAGDLSGCQFADPAEARKTLAVLLADKDFATSLGRAQRGKALALFGIKGVGEQWRALLG